MLTTEEVRARYSVARQVIVDLPVFVQGRRELLELSYNKAAAEIGMSTAHLFNILNEKKKPGQDQILKMLAWLDKTEQLARERER